MDSYIHRGRISNIDIINIKAKSDINIKIHRYIESINSYKEIEKNIADLTKFISKINSKTKKDSVYNKLTSLIEKRTFLITNIIQLLICIAKENRHINENGVLDSIVDGKLKKAYDYLVLEIKKPDNLNYKRLKDLALMTALKARLQLLISDNILHINTYPSELIFDLGSEISLATNDLVFHGQYLFEYGEFMYINSKLEESYNIFDRVLNLSTDKNESIYELKGNSTRNMFDIKSRISNIVDVKLFNKAADFYKNLSDDKKSKRLTSYLLNDAGLAFKRHNKLDSAEKYYLQSLAMKNSFTNDNREDIIASASTKNNISLVYKARKEWNKALSYSNIAIQDLESLDIIPYLEYSNTLNNKATIINLSGDRSSAIDILEQVQKIRASKLSLTNHNNNEKLANIYHNLAVLYKQENSLSNAHEKIIMSIELYRDLYKISPKKYAYLYLNCLITKASILKESGLYTEALTELGVARLIVIESTHLASQQKHLGRIFNNMANTLKKADRFHEALEYAKQSIKIFEDKTLSTYDGKALTLALNNALSIAQLLNDTESCSWLSEKLKSV